MIANINGICGLNPRYNIAPSRDIPIIRNTDTGHELVLARWRILPHWSKESKTKYSTINARIESVAEKPTYRSSFKRKRCLIPADVFYGSKQVADKKASHQIRKKIAKSSPLLVSGIAGWSITYCGFSIYKIYQYQTLPTIIITIKAEC